MANSKALDCTPGSAIPVTDLITQVNTNETSIQAHTSSIENPHSVTADQVGADPVGSADQVQTNLDAHTSNTSNPHSVTAAQVGAEPSLPIGFIGVYSGLVADIPSNWALCDGTNGTPDLTDRFVMGTVVEGDIGTTGGSNDSVVVSHTHTADHNHTASSNTTGDHNHSYTKWAGSQEFGSSTMYGARSSSSDTTGSDGAHSHTITVDTKNVTTSSAGEDGTGKNAPAYVKLAYIMKIS